MPGMKDIIWLIIFFGFVFNSSENFCRNNLIKQYSPDPCEAAKTAADVATRFSKTNSYLKAKAGIQHSAIDGKEHGISFGMDTAGITLISVISTGNYHSSTIGKVANRFADLHNHQDNSPPFSGDLYGFIGQALSSSLYQTRYILTQNGTVYALIIIDLQAAKIFNTIYPGILNPGYQLRFPDKIVDEFRFIRYGRGASEEMAFAFILEKYGTGVALLKQDSSGNFKRLRTREVTNAGGNKIYIEDNCR